MTINAAPTTTTPAEADAIIMGNETPRLRDASATDRATINNPVLQLTVQWMKR